MRKIILTIMLIVPIALMAQIGNFTLIGKVGNLNTPAKAYLLYTGVKGFTVDSMTMQNGQFEFKGSIIDPIEANLVINREGTGLRSRTNEKLLVYLESGAIKVISPDSLSKAIITGSKLNADYEKFMLTLKPSLQQQAAFYAEVNGMSEEKKKDAATRAEINKKMLQIINERIRIFTDFIKSNPNSFLSLNLLKGYSGSNPDYNKLSPLYNSLTDEVKQTQTGKAYAAFLAKINSKEYADSVALSKGVVIGTMAPEFTQNDQAGKPIKLSDFKGKYLLVDFWASWCGPCRGENPNVVKAYAIYHGKGLEILGVSLDNKKEAWLKAIADDKLNWKHVSDLKGWNNEAAALYGIHSIPANLLIDPNGKVIGKDLRGSELEDRLAEIFK